MTLIIEKGIPNVPVEFENRAREELEMLHSDISQRWILTLSRRFDRGNFPAELTEVFNHGLTSGTLRLINTQASVPAINEGEVLFVVHPRYTYRVPNEITRYFKHITDYIYQQEIPEPIPPEDILGMIVRSYIDYYSAIPIIGHDFYTPEDHKKATETAWISQTTGLADCVKAMIKTDRPLPIFLSNAKPIWPTKAA